MKTSAENGASSVGLALDERLVVRIDALDRRDVDRRREVVDDGVEQRLHALVLERRAADDRRDLLGDRRFAKSGLQLGDLEGLAGEVLLEQLVVLFGDRLDHLLAVVLGFRAELRRDLFDVVLRAEGLVA